MKWISKQANYLTIPRQTELDFLAWGTKAMQGANRDSKLDLPLDVQRLYKDYLRSPDYEFNADSIALQAEDSANAAAGHRKFDAQPAASGSFLEQFDRLLPSTKRSWETVAAARRSGSDTDLERALQAAHLGMAQERRLAYGDPVAKILDDPEQYFQWDAVIRYHCGGKLNSEQSEYVKRLSQRWQVQKGLDTTSNLVGFDLPVSPEFFNAVLSYGAFRDLGVLPMRGGKTKYVKVTAVCNAITITPTATGAGRVIPADTAISGDSLSQQANLIATALEVSLEVIGDGKAELVRPVLEAMTQGVAARIDFCALQGTGDDNTTSGGQTGIFVHGDVASVSANQGNTTLDGLQRNDFLLAVAAVAPAALQRPCRWFCNPAFIPKLMQLKDGTGNTYLVRTPAETQGEWYCVGFPITWAAQAPSATAPGSKVAAFGHGPAMLVGMRDEMEIGSSDAPKWNQALRQLRAIARARVDCRETTFWATLKLSAQ